METAQVLMIMIPVVGVIGAMIIAKVESNTVKREW